MQMRSAHRSSQLLVLLVLNVGWFAICLSDIWRNCSARQWQMTFWHLHKRSLNQANSWHMKCSGTVQCTARLRWMDPCCNRTAQTMCNIGQNCSNNKLTAHFAREFWMLLLACVNCWTSLLNSLKEKNGCFLTLTLFPRFKNGWVVVQLLQPPNDIVWIDWFFWWLCPICILNSWCTLGIGYHEEFVVVASETALLVVVFGAIVSAAEILLAKGFVTLGPVNLRDQSDIFIWWMNACLVQFIKCHQSRHLKAKRQHAIVQNGCKSPPKENMISFCLKTASGASPAVTPLHLQREGCLVAVHGWNTPTNAQDSFQLLHSKRTYHLLTLPNQTWLIWLSSCWMPWTKSFTRMTSKWWS